MALCISCGRDCSCKTAPLCEIHAKGCRELAEYEAWFGHAHVIRSRCCGVCVRMSRSYELFGEGAFVSDASGVSTIEKETP